MDQMQTNTAKCGQCGGALPPGAPEGLCPRCLMVLNWSVPTETTNGETSQEGNPPTNPPPGPPLPIAEVARLFPSLEILDFLGSGGMGSVYKARQPRLDRLVALKILLPEKQAEPRFGERFEREARALARLNHSNIVAVYDFGQVERSFYLLMEFVEGVTLRQLLRSRKMAPEEALAIVPRICEALQYAHDQGIVHRDIKPENILLDQQGRVKIADFGIAKILGGKQAGPALTAGGQVVGTPHYMAPEQIEKPQTVDHRADLYSLGVVFYEMLTGELPLGKFPAPSSRLHGVQIDVRLDVVVLRALEKEPERRYQHASNIKTDVETIASTPAPSSVTLLRRRVGWQPGWKLPLAVAACLAVLASGWLLWRGRAERRLERKVSYRANQASVQDVVQTLAQQVGLQYDWQTSFDQTDPLCRRWVTNLVMEGESCREALAQVLKPVKLQYQLRHGTIVLSLAGGEASAKKFEAARQALTGPRKDIAGAKKLLLELVEKDQAALAPGSLCCAYVYLGYIEDRATNRDLAVRWYQQALEIQDAGDGLLNCASSGLRRPLTWIRHLDAGTPPPAE
ncbi:putative Mitogen-activated protein kinase kinase [Verrucomicrobia bacterium]|nr:putative Mitogen-activated protein kinase kinase [Verrucomicrobiota bacterium]